MDEPNSETERVADAIESVGVDRLADAVLDAWEAAGLETGTPDWPDDEPRFRVRPPASDGGARLDAVAAALDATPRSPDTAFLYLAVGRRSDLGRDRAALEDLARHPDVTVDDDHTAGTVPMDGETVAALVDLVDAVEYALVRDGDGTAVVEWRDETVRVALPAAAADAMRAELPDALAARVEREDQSSVQ
ncbi:hypothetical protein [Haloarcula litorea]|uniref:hypothetical protein n=1 Tax=Haloarcula litorea TaxID=3032579 RepID=UPI0023E8F563|nr:hypothetical protein [Halomicroarcula sp. GDY20]